MGQVLLFQSHLDSDQDNSQDRCKHCERVGKGEKQAQERKDHSQEYGIAGDGKKALLDQWRLMLGIYSDSPGCSHLRLRNAGPNQR